MSRTISGAGLMACRPWQVADATPVEAARAHAIRFLARREHSRLELRRKLGSRGHDAGVVEKVLVELARAGLQSDARFAEGYVRSAIGRGQGPVKIRATLRARGINAEGANDALDTNADWPRLARAALAKRFGAQPPTDRAAWARQARFLAGRGYPADIVSRAIGDVDDVHAA